jgi:hypothetical protein
LNEAGDARSPSITATDSAGKCSRMPFISAAA